MAAAAVNLYPPICIHHKTLKCRYRALRKNDRIVVRSSYTTYALGISPEIESLYAPRDSDAVPTIDTQPYHLNFMHVEIML